MSEYIKQATEFLQKAHAEMKIEYVGLAVNKEWKKPHFILKYFFEG